MLFGISYGAAYTGSIYYSLRLPHGASRAAGLHATFLGKPFNDEGGSGFHLHVSLVDAGTSRNVMGDADSDDGLSAVAHQATAGVNE